MSGFAPPAGADLGAAVRNGKVFTAGDLYRPASGVATALTGFTTRARSAGTARLADDEARERVRHDPQA